MLAGGIGHLRIESLENGKTAEVARQVESVVKQGAKRIVLDLRHCASGDPKEGLALADLFLDDGLMTYLQGQKVPRQDFRAVRENTISRLPMVVAINRGTARGGEVAAAALLENKRGEVVGERSYGDAAWRKAVPLEDGGAVILSVAKYHSPGGKALQDTGVVPSVVALAREPAAEAEGEEPRIAPRPEPTLEEDTILKRRSKSWRKARSRSGHAPVTSPADRQCGMPNIVQPRP
jgi:carboxyl-terminal processing protease